MPRNHTPSSGSDNIPTPSYKPSQQLITAIPGIPTAQAKEQAARLLDGARYLNHTGIMLGDHRRVAASHYLNMMVRALFDELEHSRPQARSPAGR
ncbi:MULTISPECIES: DUF3077 domain-containing protein [Pseudomonas]|uniref:DUF3077 domain-containing protein n=1 Tax=Pseudomonas TaxID=286 RepID=UPI000C195836|nr:DUF3077 domain-containing protein [Stenotrophomonas rhizophila]MBS3184599.1 DUF3077 domain-containing protein [Pseudomonas sp. PCH44]PIK78408.1 hypothetical protein CQW31_11340 [Pseudomonas sp. 382]